jgi:Pyridoxamine 5'-phosphate oxidase
MTTWGDFEAEDPDLAAFGAGRLAVAPAYLATVRQGGAPRVHPVTPIIGGGRLFVFMEPTSPKGRDLQERGWYSLHNGVPDMSGSGGEFSISGKATLVDDPDLRNVAARAASYQPADHYILFELGVNEARGNGYGDEVVPARRRWVPSIG